MSMLVLIMCLNSMPSCDTTNAPAVWRATMQNMQCSDEKTKLFNRIVGESLNPVNGYYVISCEKQDPAA